MSMNTRLMMSVNTDIKLGKFVAIDKYSKQASSFFFNTKKAFAQFKENSPINASRLILISHTEYVYLTVSTNNPIAYPPRPLKVLMTGF